MIKKLKYTLITIVILALVGVVVYFTIHKSERKVEVGEGRIHNVETMAQLCSVELYNEIPVRDTVNNKEIFAIQKQRGSVSFDMEKLDIRADGDTVYATLPPEIVELYESTDPNSWEVIDTKGLSLFTSDKLTAEEDNIVKSRLKKRAKRLLYQNGTIRRARQEGVLTLQSFLEKLYKKPALVRDTLFREG